MNTNYLIETERLGLRKWMEEDADSLYEYAKDPDIGPITGWPAHKSREVSLDTIRHVLDGPECYAICEKEKGIAIGSIELMISTRAAKGNKEAELGFWMGKPFWGRGYMPEAAKALIERGFTTLGLETIWCGYFDGNQKSKRTQEKMGFTYHHTNEKVELPLLGEVRTEHLNILTKEQWEER